MRQTPLAALVSFREQDENSPIPICFADYLELTDYLARAIHPRKRGSTPESLPHIFDRLGLMPDLAEHFDGWTDGFGQHIGRAQFHCKGARLESTAVPGGGLRG